MRAFFHGSLVSTAHLRPHTHPAHGAYNRRTLIKEWPTKATEAHRPRVYAKGHCCTCWYKAFVCRARRSGNSPAGQKRAFDNAPVSSHSVGIRARSKYMPVDDNTIEELESLSTDGAGYRDVCHPSSRAEIEHLVALRQRRFDRRRGNQRHCQCSIGPRTRGRT